MSQSATAVRVPRGPAARTGTRVPQPRLRVLAPAPRRSRAGLAVLCVTLLGLGLMLLLMLNISLSRGSYQLYAQQAQLEQLTEQRQALEEDLDARRAPQQLAERAADLGMVPAGNPAYLRLSDGKVLGKAQRASAPPRPAAKKAADRNQETAKKQDGATKKQDTAKKQDTTGKQDGATTNPSP